MEGAENSFLDGASSATASSCNHNASLSVSARGNEMNDLSSI